MNTEPPVLMVGSRLERCDLVAAADDVEVALMIMGEQGAAVGCHMVGGATAYRRAVRNSIAMFVCVFSLLVWQGRCGSLIIGGLRRECALMFE